METDDKQVVQMINQNEKLKLFKNTKGYNWEIQLLEIDLERLEEINNKLIEKFGESDAN